MKDGPPNRPWIARGRKEPDRAGRRGDVLGLRAFEKISAVEGIRLSAEMRKDLKSLDARRMDEDQRSRFISGKYGKK